MDELRTLREMRADTPPMTPEAERAARLRLLTTAPEPERRHHRAPKWSLGAAAALTAGAVAVAAAPWLVSSLNEDVHPILGSLPRGEGPPEVVTPVSNVSELGERAARNVETDPDPVAGPKQWTYLRSADAGFLKPGTTRPPKTTVQESWVNFSDGRMRMSYPEEKTTREAGVGPWTDLSRYTATDPAALHRQLLDAADADNRHLRDFQVRRHREDPDAQRPWRLRPATDQDAFGVVNEIMRFTAPPPRLQAALYRTLPRLKGVRLRRGATDATGRAGIAFAMATNGGRTTDEIILSERDYRYLGSRRIVVRSGAGKEDEMPQADTSNVRPGTILSWSAQLAKKVVDGPGKRS